MQTHLVLVADGSRARLFALERAKGSSHSRRLTEQVDLVNPEHQQKQRDRLTGSRSEARGHVHGQWYGLDDHRDRQESEHERRFAGLIAAEAKKLATSLGATHLALVASPRMLGLIRSEGKDLLSSGLEIHEDSSDLTKMTPAEIQERLERSELLPGPQS